MSGLRHSHRPLVNRLWQFLTRDRHQLNLLQHAPKVLATLLAILFQPPLELSSHVRELIADRQRTVPYRRGVEQKVEQRIPKIALPVLPSATVRIWPWRAMPPNSPS